MKNGPRIIFMGTPDFAVPTLAALHENGYHVVQVVTQPDRPKGRGRKLSPPPVKTAALRLGYRVIQPATIRTAEFEKSFRELEPQFLVVVAFGHILPSSLLALPGLAAINVHASLLPKYRGPAPIQWALINGETQTGVTTMLMDAGMDTGDILLSSSIIISSEDTAGTVHDRLAVLGAELLIQTLKSVYQSGINPIPQDHTLATYAPLLRKSDGHINWEMPAKDLDCFIRGMNPWPGAFTFHRNKRFKIFKASPIEKELDAPPGTVLKSFPGELNVATGKGILSVMEIQSASGKRMLIEDFLRGYQISPGYVLH